VTRVLGFGVWAPQPLTLNRIDGIYGVGFGVRGLEFGVLWFGD